MSKRYINLYDPGLRRQRQWLTVGNLAVAAGLLAALLAIWSFLAHQEVAGLTERTQAGNQELQALQQETATLGTELLGRRPNAAINRELQDARRLLEIRQSVLGWLKQGQTSQGSYADYLRGLARQVVSGLWLTAFLVEADQQRMEIRGRTADPASLPEFIRRLNRERAFQGQGFAQLTMNAVSKPANVWTNALPNQASSAPSGATPTATAGSVPVSMPASSSGISIHEFVLTTNTASALAGQTGAGKPEAPVSPNQAASMIKPESAMAARPPPLPGGKP